jgi:hypothetical protein
LPAGRVESTRDSPELSGAGRGVLLENNELHNDIGRPLSRGRVIGHRPGLLLSSV